MNEINPAKKSDEIVEKIDTILSLAEKWGIENLEIHSAWAPNEKEALNFIATVKKNISFYNVSNFAQNLEEILGCNVNVNAKELIDDYAYEKRKESSIVFSKENILKIQNILMNNSIKDLSLDSINNDYQNDNKKSNKRKLTSDVSTFFPPSKTQKLDTKNFPSADLIDLLKKISSINDEDFFTVVKAVEARQIQYKQNNNLF